MSFLNRYTLFHLSIRERTKNAVPITGWYFKLLMIFRQKTFIQKYYFINTLDCT